MVPKNETEYDGDYFGDLPAAGYRSVVDAMATGLDVRTGVEAAEIVLSADGVAVHGAGGGVEEGSHVVVAVPLGALKRGAPRFSPRLPADRGEAIERLGFGHFEKVAVRFEEPFWRGAGLPHVMLFPRDPGEAADWAIGQDAFGAGPTLVFLVFASVAAATWTYRAVVLMLLWPSRTWMVRRSVPASSKWVAKLWRRVWTVTCLPRPALWQARPQTCHTLSGVMGALGSAPGKR